MSANRKLDFDYLLAHGQISLSDAKHLHRLLWEAIDESTTEETIIADWNESSPEALWDCAPEAFRGKYADYLTQMTAAFMREEEPERWDLIELSEPCRKLVRALEESE